MSTDTPAGDAEAVAEIVYGAMKWAADQSCTDSHPTWVPRGNSHAQDRARDAARSIAALAAEAVAAERERCAKVADTAVTYVVGEQRDLCDRIATAIREQAK